LLLPMTNIASN